jgi:protein tyrosine phosphatase (PTP) superfamily phosphohydrolase (DUF442 family)
MPITLTVTTCSLPVAGDVCYQIVNNINNATYYVTAQPIYVWPGTSPYPIIAQAGIDTVLSVRDPQEVILPLTPVDLTEVSQLISSDVAFTNVPLPHITMTQEQFDEQAYKAATVINDWPNPLLVHCSTGDRASAAFAAFLITYGGFANDAALAFAIQKLALQNTQFIAWIQAYAPPQ